MLIRFPLRYVEYNPTRWQRVQRWWYQRNRAAWRSVFFGALAVVLVMLFMVYIFIPLEGRW
jgi:hypothetical protein